MSRIRTVLLSLSAATALGSLVLLVAPAGAAQAVAPPSGDPRATSYAGNATTCADGGLAGSIVDVTYTIDASGTYVTITAVPEGTTLTGVVVKGGPAYNVYVGDVRTALHAPVNSSGKPAQISHWYACGTTGGTTSPSTPSNSPTTPSSSPTTPSSSPTTPSSSPTTPSTSPTTPSGSPTTPSGSPTTPSGSPTTPSGSPTSPSGTATASVTPTVPGGSDTPPPTSPAAGPGEVTGGGGLALTGSQAASFGGLGLALLLAGVALLRLPRGRHAR